MAWSMKGTYFESCSCETACPCIFLSPPTEGECMALVGWHIDEGIDGDVSLSGLNMALAVHSPGHMAETPWTVAVYVDARASEAQQGSLLKIFGGKGGGHPARLASHIGEIIGVTAAPIEFTANGGDYSLKIPAIAEVEINKMAGQGDGPVTVTGHPLCIAPGHTATLARTRALSYSDHGKSWELTGKAGLFSGFAYQSD